MHPVQISVSFFLENSSATLRKNVPVGTRLAGEITRDSSLRKWHLEELRDAGEKPQLSTEFRTMHESTSLRGN